MFENTELLIDQPSSKRTLKTSVFYKDIMPVALVLQIKPRGNSLLFYMGYGATCQQFAIDPEVLSS